MRPRSSGLFVVLPLAAMAGLLLGQRNPEPAPLPRLPDGRSQTDAILKEDHAKTLKDVKEVLKLAEELQEELEKNDRHVLSVGALKKTEEIEKLAKRIRSRMKRY